MPESPDLPLVLAFGGMDPTGGAGLQADIESLASIGVHCAPVTTAVTVQDSQALKRYQAMEPSLVIEQARAVLEDMPAAAFKIGMMGSVQNVEAIHSILMDYPHLPVVLDPLLEAGGGGALGDDEVPEAMATLLFPLTTVLTPNSHEVLRFATEADSIDAGAMELLETGCDYVLVTGTHESTPHVVNTLYSGHQVIETYTWERLPASFHGSGCTLASALAGMLAQGLDPVMACLEAQEYTWEALQNGYRLGMGQLHPNRFYWARDADGD